MKDNEHQQQVLFDEPNQKKMKEDASINQQVIFHNDDSFVVTDVEHNNDELMVQQLHEQHNNADIGAITSGKKSWLWTLITVLLILITTIETTLFFMSGFKNSPIMTGFYAALFACLCAVSIRSLWREISGLRHFKTQQEVKKQAIYLLNQTGGASKEAEDFCQQITDNLPCDIAFDNADEQRNWRSSVDSHHSSHEILQLYSREVLNIVDEKALNEVAKFSTEAVVLVSLSPIAIVDMLIMLSRNLRMINKISGLYGLKLGYWSRIKLIKQVFVNMAYAGASEIISDLGSDLLGAELLGKLSTRFAQGLGAGMLTARLGVKTMQLCRPIPFDDKPKLSRVRKKLVSQIKTLISPHS
jgi:putative membrane protein